MQSPPGGSVRRRDFVTAIICLVSGLPFAVHAQQSTLVGYLGLTSMKADSYYLVPFRKALSDAGFDDGRNINIEYLFAEGDVSRLPGLAAELVRRNVAIIFTATTVSALAAKAATSTIPVVFAIGADPVRSGLVSSLNRPGGNLTGVSFFTNQMEAKRLGLLHEVAPKADLIAVLLNPNNPFFDNQLKDVDAASRALNLKVQIERAGNERDIVSVFKKFEQLKAGALLVGADPYFNSKRALVIDPAINQRLPAIYEWREFADAGGLMSYGTSLTEAYRQAGDVVVRILKGAKPAELPVLQSDKFEFLINLKTAKAIGLEVPMQLQQRATEFVE